MKVYVILKNEILETRHSSFVFTDVVGVFENYKDADIIIRNYKENEKYFYEIKEIPMNILLDEDKENDILKELTKDDSIEILIGEDGNFYFEARNE